MKSIIVLLFVGLVSSCLASENALEKTVEPKISTNIDKYVDVLLGLVSKWLINQGMDPMQMENITKTFSVKPIIITYHAEMYLTRGWMLGISDMKRSGAAELSYEAMFLNLKLPLSFETISVDYDYDVEVMGLLKHKGGLEARISNLHLYVDIIVDTKTLETSLQEFKITDAGVIEVKLSGHPLIDWLANVVTKLVTTLLHDMVQNKIETQVRSIVENAINQINNKLPPHSKSLPCLN